MVIGDFNKILSNREKLGRAERAERQMQDFREALEVCGLKDLGFKGSWFAWNNRRHRDMPMSRSS